MPRAEGSEGRPFMLYLHCTAKLAKAARVKLESAPDTEGLHWLDCWYATLVPLTSSTDLVLITNARSLFSIVIPQPAENITFFAVVSEFGRKFRAVPASLGVDDEAVSTAVERHSQFVTCKTASRSVLGSMSEMAFHFRFLARRNTDEMGEIGIEDLERMLNTTPLSPLGYQYPVHRFIELLADH